MNTTLFAIHKIQILPKRYNIFLYFTQYTKIDLYQIKHTQVGYKIIYRAKQRFVFFVRNYIELIRFSLMLPTIMNLIPFYMLGNQSMSNGKFLIFESHTKAEVIQVPYNVHIQSIQLILVTWCLEDDEVDVTSDLDLIN